MILSNLGGNAKFCAAALAGMLVLTCAPGQLSAQEAEDSMGAVTETQDAEPGSNRGKSIVRDGSPGMYLEFNGKSVRTFEKSLDAVQEQTTEAEFTTVEEGVNTFGFAGIYNF